MSELRCTHVEYWPPLAKGDRVRGAEASGKLLTDESDARLSYIFDGGHHALQAATIGGDPSCCVW